LSDAKTKVIFRTIFLVLKNFCYKKGNNKRMKRYAIDWEKIFAKSIHDKRLGSKIYKAFLKLNI
jgi:hypothetical protein